MAQRGLSLLRSGKYSDLTIVCDDQHFKCHRAVVCPLSSFFTKACDGGFKEAFEQKIELGEEHPHTVERFLSFMYTDDYSDNERTIVGTELSSPEDSGSADRVRTHQLDSAPEDTIMDGIQTEFPTPPSTLLNNVKVYAAAEKYDIVGLKELAIKKFSKAIENNAADDEILQSVSEVYESTPSSDRGLREIVALACAHRATSLAQLEAYRETCIEIGEFAFDMQVVAFQLVKTQQEEYKKLRDDLSSKIFLIHNDLSVMAAEKERLQGRYYQVDSLLDATIERINCIDECPNNGCDNEVDGLSISRRGLYPGVAIDIRCSKCRARLR